MIRSTFGFGEALVAVPLLAFCIPLEVAAPLAVLVSITMAAIVVVQDWKKIHLRSTGWLVLSTLFGIPLGLLLLTSSHQRAVKGALGVIIVAFSVYSLIGRTLNGGDTRQITSAALGVEQFAWRPDGSSFAFVSPDEPPNKVEIEKHHDLFEVGDNDFLATSAPTPSHIWLVSASGGTAKRLTSGAWSLAKTAEDYPSFPLSWSPDGKLICFTRQADPHFGDSDQTVVEILDVDGGKSSN